MAEWTLLKFAAEGHSPMASEDTEIEVLPASTVLPRPAVDWDGAYADHPVNELLAQNAGSQSPFGDDITFPLPVEALYYTHPDRSARPNLAGGR